MVNPADTRSTGREEMRDITQRHDVLVEEVEELLTGARLGEDGPAANGFPGRGAATRGAIC